ncbi:MAG: hybrid sensor histidine kinase/response regulator [Elusimicrobiota bacterium]
MSKCRALVVEDYALSRDLYVRQLESFGLEVASAANGERALEIVEGESFDLILTDISMPGKVDGVDLVKRVKAEKPGIDMIVMTAFPSLDSAVATLRDGAYDYLTKPFTKDQLRAVVDRCLEKRRIAAELSEEKSLRRELQAAYAELQKTEKLKDAFMSRVNHELRTPLMAAKASVEMLDHAPAGDRAGLMDRARGALSRLSDVVADLLTFSDLLKGDPSRHREPVDLAAVLRELFESCRPLFEKKEVEIRLDLGDGLPKVSADPAAVRTALKHLVANAALFNRYRGLVSARLAAFSGGVRLTIENTGMDLPADQADQVFDSFYQMAEVLTRQVGGLGLGLAVARRIIETHGGLIRASSRKGGGAVFDVELPAAQYVDPPDGN